MASGRQSGLGAQSHGAKRGPYSQRAVPQIMEAHPVTPGRRQRAAGGAAGCAALLTLTACAEKNVYAPPPPPRVIVEQPLRQPVTRYIELTGNTQAFNQVDLEARVQGFLEKIGYVDGALVKKDQV